MGGRKWVVVFLKVEFGGREERKKMKERDSGSEKERWRGGNSRASFLFLFVFIFYFLITQLIFSYFFNLIFHLFNLKNDYMFFLNFFNSIITHVACHVGIDWSKLVKRIKVANRLNLRGAKIVIFVHRGPKLQLFET